MSTPAPTSAPSSAPSSSSTSSASASASASALIPPNHTVYVHNLNEKIQIEELKKSLYHVFGQFGKVVDIQAKKSLTMRGQAFIIFDDLAAATRAVRDMHNFQFYGKPMLVSYAKVKSDVIAQRDGTFVPRPKRKVDAMDVKAESANKVSKKSISQTATHAAHRTSAIVDEDLPPNHILFVQNLPEAASVPMLQALFGPYDGFKEARLIEARPGIAFVEFQSEFQSTNAMQALQGFKVTPVNAMHISYAKK